MTQVWGDEIVVNGIRPKWLADTDEYLWRDDRPGASRVWVEGGAATVFGPYCGRADDIIGVIKLPVDHWAYSVLNAGFCPWQGGDKAPSDWDGGTVLVLDDAPYDCDPRELLRPFPDNWAGTNHHVKIIGYRKKVAEQPVAEETLTPFTQVTVSGAFRNAVYKEAYGQIVERRPYTTGYTVEMFDGEVLTGIPRSAIALRDAVAEQPQPEAEADTVTIPRMTEAEIEPWLRANGWQPSSLVRSHVTSAFRDLGIIRDESRLERFARITGVEITDANRSAVEAALGFRD